MRSLLKKEKLQLNNRNTANMKNSLKLKIVACAIAAFTNITLTSAHCQDTVVMGSNHQTGGEGAGDRQTMQNILNGMRNLQGR